MKKIIFPLCVLATTQAMALSQKGFDLEFYGFLKASAMYSSEALASYNNINLSAPTHAVAHTKDADEKGRLSFQTQQSRIGFNLKKDQNLTGKFEFDFIDFSKSSPTTQMNPRVRIASATYAWANQKIIVGQDWDLFSPVTSFTYDYVGLYFLAGNTGFMRQQLQYLNHQDKWEFGAAVGMAGNNPGTMDSDLETGKSPSYAARVSYALNSGRVGASAIYARLKYEANDSTHDAYGYNLFFENNYSLFNVKSEAYYGQNLANIGSLSIGKGTATEDVKEYGATLTAQYKLNQKHIPFGGLGVARVDNKASVTPISFNANNVITNPGITSNFLMRAGWEYKVTEDFSWVSEVSHYETTSKLTSSQIQTQVVASVESGVQLRF